MNNEQRFSGEWETKRLGDIGEISGAGVNKKIIVNEESVRLVNYLDVYNKSFLYSKDLTHEVTAKPDQIRRCAVEKGDVFFTPSSEVPDDIGCSAVAMEDIPDGVYSYHVVRLRLKTDWDIIFRAYVFNTKEFLDQASRQCDGSGTRYVISLPKFRDMTVRFPPTIEEQQAIAEVLSDVDGLINALDALIAKKRAIKQATMQQLLTGKRRLPGFSGEWEAKRLGDIFSIRAGSSKSQYVTQGGRYIIVDMGSVATDGQLIISKFTDYEGDFLKEGDLVMPKDDIGGGKIIGKVAYIDANDLYVLGDHVYALRLIGGFPKFFSYLINGYETNSSLRRKVGGSAQLGLSRKAVEDQEVPIPNFDEQRAIATVFTDMDTAITALEQRRDKTIAIKQGMMQQLLAGKVRLVK